MYTAQPNTNCLRSNAALAPAAMPHNRPLEATDRPERAMGIGYGRSSGYASRESYSGSRHYVSNHSPALFRIS